jgi:hypothetical protein
MLAWRFARSEPAERNIKINSRVWSCDRVIVSQSIGIADTHEGHSTILNSFEEKSRHRGLDIEIARICR